ncbi:MAG: molybdate ABC transporter substrate-binding protein [Bacillota bacterium]
MMARWSGVNSHFFFLICIALFMAGCRAGEPSGKLRISAASSLTETMEEMAKEFQKEHPRIRIELNFGGSQVLRHQIEQGASADLFFSADAAQIRLLEQSGLLNGVKRFAQNKMVLIVSKERARQIDKISDLGLPGVSIAMGIPQVPAGRYAKMIIDKVATKEEERKVINNNVVTLEFSVREVLAKVLAGEADAGFVFATDVRKVREKGVKVIEIPPGTNVTAEYYVGKVAAAKNSEISDQFVRFIFSAQGQEILRREGFNNL